MNRCINVAQHRHKKKIEGTKEDPFHPSGSALSPMNAWLQRKCNHRCLINALNDRIIVVQKAQRTGNMALYSFLCALAIGY